MGIWHAVTIGNGTVLKTPASDGSNGQVLTTNGAGQLTFSTIVGTSLPVADNNAIVKGDLDATKQLRFEVDTYVSSGSTRVIVMADQDIDLRPNVGTYLGKVTGITDNAVARFDTASGGLQNSGVTIDDNDKLKTKATYSDIQVNSDSATITFDMNLSNVHTVTLGGDRTLAVTNVSVGQRFIIRLTQDSTGGRTVTWWSGINWAGGVVPVLTSTAGKTDVFGFLCTGAGSYDGFVIGQDI